MGVFPKNAKIYRRYLTPCDFTSGVHNTALIIDRRKFTTKWSLYGCLVSIFTVEIDSNSFSWSYAPYKKPPQIFGDVRCPILGKPSAPLCRLADWRGRKAGLNWKLNISNTADNADITQSEAHDSRYRRMHEINSLCTDSRSLYLCTHDCVLCLYQITITRLKQQKSHIFPLWNFWSVGA